MEWRLSCLKSVPLKRHSMSICLLNLNVNIYSNFLNLEFPKNSKNLEINFIDNKDNFNEDEWTSLYKLSENTFVEETDSLKKGAAGAGLTDND